MTRDEVMKEFGYDVLVSFVSPVVAESMRSLADEIVRLRAILAALLEPSDEIVDVMAAIAWNDSGVIFSTYAAKAIIRAAAATAEQEVSHDAS